MNPPQNHHPPFDDSPPSSPTITQLKIYNDGSIDNLEQSPSDSGVKNQRCIKLISYDGSSDKMSKIDLVKYDRMYQNEKYNVMLQTAIIDDKIKVLNKKIDAQLRKKEQIKHSFENNKQIETYIFLKYYIIQFKNNIKYKLFSCLS